MYCRANSRFASIDSRVSSGLPTISPPTTNMPLRGRGSIASMLALPVRGAPFRPACLARAVARRFLGARPQERQGGVDDVLDAEEDVAKPGAPHQRREPCPVLGDW